MVLAKNKLVNSTPIRGPALMGKRHIEIIFNKYVAQNEPMPFAIVIGVSPAQLMTAAMNLPADLDEASIAGGLMLEPIPMIKAQLSDILIPADAEIVMEGHIYPGETAEEGPFAGISHYTERGTGLVYTVELISHRKNPILPFVTPAVKTSDTLALFSVLHSHELFELLRKQAFPVRWVTLPVEAKLCLCFVSTDTHLHAGLPKRIASIIFARSPLVEHLVILDSDVDSEDLATAFNDSHQKAHPGRNYHISRIDRILSPAANHDLDTGKSSTLYVDATWRVDRPPINIPKRVGFETSYPLDMQERVIKRWEELGLFPKPVWRKYLAQS
jgi:4-hydroxy-3-polyprenylbenzoate decarboxylase